LPRETSPSLVSLTALPVASAFVAEFVARE